MPRRKTLTKKKHQRGGDGNINSILKSVTNAQTSGEKKPANTSTTMTTNMSQIPTLSAFTPGANISKAANTSTKSANTMMKAANTSTKSANSMMKAANTRTNVKSDLSMDLSKLSTNPPELTVTPSVQATVTPSVQATVTPSVQAMVTPSVKGTKKLSFNERRDNLIKMMDKLKQNLEIIKTTFESLMTDTAAAV
jgi:hypothetical protein